MKKHFFVLLLIIISISGFSVYAQPVASEGNGFLISTATSGFPLPPLKDAATNSEPLFIDQPVASMPFLPNTDPLAVSFRIITALFFVILTAFFISWLIQKKGVFNGNVFGKVIGVLPLDSRRFIYIVDIVGRVLVLGVTDTNISFLCEINDKEVLDSLRLEGQTSTLPGMDKLFSFLKNKRSEETADHELGIGLSDVTLKNQSSKNQERLRKINSLLVKRNPDDFKEPE